MSLPVYEAREIRKIDNGQNVLHSIEVGIFRIQDNVETQVGSYTRNFSFLHRTFYHFRKNGKDYALYSPVYTATRVMELPSCNDIGGEEPHISFCPVDYYVPWEDKPEDPEEDHILKADFGFVAGVHWGEVYPTAHIQYLDLSRVEKGIICRDDRFGNIGMPFNCTLEQTVFINDDTFDEFPVAFIGTLQIFDMNTGKNIT
jgi:hypothetical protein